MNNYFNLLERVSKLDNSNYGIAQLSKLIYDNAGGHIVTTLKKSGRTTSNVEYINKFNDILVAKWLMYYKNLFVSKLIKHPEMKAFHVDIINRTFMQVFKYFDPTKATTDNQVSRYVNMALSNRIGEALYVMGSETRLKQYLDKSSNEELHDFKKSKNRLSLKKSMNYMAISLDELSANNVISDTESIEHNSIMIELANKLSVINSSLAYRLLEAMLYSGKKVQTYKIDDYMNMSREECTSDNKKIIVKAWNIIKDVLHTYISDDEYYSKNNKLNWKHINKVYYSFEV